MVAVAELAIVAIVARRVAAARQVTRSQRPLAAEVAGEAMAVSQLAERAVLPRAERNQVTAHHVAIVVILATLRSSLTHLL